MTENVGQLEKQPLHIPDFAPPILHLRSTVYHWVWQKQRQRVPNPAASTRQNYHLLVRLPDVYYRSPGYCIAYDSLD